ncbi:MAG: right-handed parallel beta-helix repeat-containing protein [Planctomycetota bacterium]|jgi:hypothetical protein
MFNFGRTMACCLALALSVWAQGGDEKPWEKRQRDNRDRMGGAPRWVLDLQSTAKVKAPPMDVAIASALAAARKAALPLIDPAFHKGARRIVPDEFKTIQGAIDASASGDVVVVKPGTYFELLVMKDGVKLVSDSADGGDELVAVAGARLKLPRRALRTILDGSKSKPSHHGMIDFNPGVGRKTIVDGFTIQGLPEQNHHIPGHAHGLNVRGASPVIMNCYLLGNGSTGIGNHVVYHDQGAAMDKRDFRWANVKHKAEAVIYNNVIRGSVGLGIGCNHFSAPRVLGNELFANSDAKLGEMPSPGLGAKHGATPIIVGNLVHDNPGGGILSRKGDPQGAHPIDRRTQPTVDRNVVYRNGKLRPAISCAAGGTEQAPVKFTGNWIYGSGLAGVGLSAGAVGIIERNFVSDSGAPGIAIDGATALKLNHNRVTRAKGAGFIIVRGAKVVEMAGNASEASEGPRFVVRDATIVKPVR